MSQVTLKQLIDNADFFKDILPILEKHYKFYVDNEGVQQYLQVFQKLKHMNSVDSDYEIYIDENKNVSGYKIDENGQEQLYGLEYVPWRKWLGMKIHFDTLLRYNDYEIIAHCLWEMTWVSFDEEKIQKEYQELEEMVKDEDDEIQFIPLEEVIKENDLDIDKIFEELLKDDEEDDE